MLFELKDNLMESVWPNELNSNLLGRLKFINNDNDQHIVCESADWACSSDSDNLLTSDNDDLLSDREHISKLVDRNRDLETLHLFSAAEFLSEDPDFQFNIDSTR